jgi:hypothetical protein
MCRVARRKGLPYDGLHGAEARGHDLRGRRLLLSRREICSVGFETRGRLFNLGVSSLWLGMLELAQLMRMSRRLFVAPRRFIVRLCRLPKPFYSLPSHRLKSNRAKMLQHQANALSPAVTHTSAVLRGEGVGSYSGH